MERLITLLTLKTQTSELLGAVITWLITFLGTSAQCSLKDNKNSRTSINGKKNKMGISVESTEWLLLPLGCFQIEMEFGNVGFCGGRKTKVPGEKPSEQRREPTTNSTHI